MRKVTPFAVLALGTLVALSGVAFAQESATVPNSMAPKNVRGIIEDIRAQRNDIKAEIKDARKDIKKESAELREDTKAKMSAATSSAERRAIEKNAIVERKGIIDERKASTTVLKGERKALAQQHLRIIAHRYGIAIRQFENLAARIQSRIDKISAEGGSASGGKTGEIDVSSAESALGTALSAIAQVKTDVRALGDLISQAASGTDEKAIRAQVETAVKKANASIRAAHKSLGAAAKTLVELLRSQKATATSTREDSR